MKKKQYLYFRNLLVLSMLLLFTGCEQKEQRVEESQASTEEPSAEKTPLPVEVPTGVTDNQLFYAEGMESISINEKNLTAGKEVNETVQIAEGENEISGIDLVSCLGEGFTEDSWPVARSGFDYQMAWYDFNQDGRKELIFAGGDKHTSLACSVFQFEVIEETVNGQLEYFLEPKIILEIQEGVRAYVNDNNEICVVDAENHISKRTVPL